MKPMKTIKDGWNKFTVVVKDKDYSTREAVLSLSAHSSQGLCSECSALLERARHLAHTTATAAMAAVTATAIMMRTILSRLRTDN